MFGINESTCLELTPLETDLETLFRQVCAALPEQYYRTQFLYHARLGKERDLCILYGLDNFSMSGGGKPKAWVHLAIICSENRKNKSSPQWQKTSPISPFPP